jgi:hypothetical protein
MREYIEHPAAVLTADNFPGVTITATGDAYTVTGPRRAVTITANQYGLYRVTREDTGLLVGATMFLDSAVLMARRAVAGRPRAAN